MPNISFINLDRRKPIEIDLHSGFGGFIGNFWEKICRDAITGNEVFGILFGKASKWLGSVKTDAGLKQFEFDVVAESLDHNYILIGECKWTNPEIATVLIKELNEKSKYLPFCRGKEIIPVLFLKNKPKDDICDKDIRILYHADIIKLMK